MVKSLKAWRSGPTSIGCEAFEEEGVSWFRITERMACVPQAFWMVWAAKKREGSGVVW